MLRERDGGGGLLRIHVVIVTMCRFKQARVG